MNTHNYDKDHLEEEPKEGTPNNILITIISIGLLGGMGWVIWKICIWFTSPITKESVSWLTFLKKHDPGIVTWCALALAFGYWLGHRAGYSSGRANGFCAGVKRGFEHSNHKKTDK